MSFVATPGWPRWLGGRGAGGTWKSTPEDFVVTEIPLAPPDGVGEHAWLWVEKVGRTTEEVAEAIALAAGAPRHEVGYAGLKDREARTQQAFTVPGEVGEVPGVQVLQRSRTRRKLRAGELAGNRFSLVVRGGDAAVAAERARRLDRMPNYYGLQRTGGGAPGRGRAILLGELPPEPYVAARFAISAYQSTLFNEVLYRRGDRPLAGDLLDDGVPTGPMYGHAMAWPTDAALRLERRVLEDEALPRDVWRRFPRWTTGTRRRLWVPVAPAVSPWPGGFRVEVVLPAGSYATVLLEELL